MSRSRRTFALLAALSMLAACSSILGIDYPPLLDEGSDAATSDVADTGQAKDVVTSCPLNEVHPCRPGCPHAFCDDFEDAGAMFASWVPPNGIVNPLVLGDGSVAYAVPGASSVQAAAFTLEGDSTKSTGALLLHRLAADAVGDPSRVDGIRLAFDGQIKKNVIAAGGPVPDAGSGLVACLANGGSKLLGPTLVLAEHAIYLAIVSDFFTGGTTAALERITDETIDIERFADVWARMSVFSGTSARARALGYVKCPEAPYVFAGSWGLSEVCIAAPEGYDLAALATDATLIVGTLLRRAGSVDLRYDNVHVDAYSAP